MREDDILEVTIAKGKYWRFGYDKGVYAFGFGWNTGGLIIVFFNLWLQIGRT